jgi:GNAT superfamily N-acetyltransferase
VDVPDFPAATLREVTGSLRHPFPAGEKHHFLARLDGRPAGTVDVGFPLRDNTHVGHVDLTVHPDLRRRGVGRRLYEHAVALVRERGRKVVIGNYVTALPGGPERDPAHAAFAAAMGASPALPEVRRRLDLDTVDGEAWSRLLADAEQRAAGYTTRAWAGEVPDDLVEEVARLEGRMNVDAPIGDLQLEQERYDAQRIRENEEVLRLRGQRHYHIAVTHDASGTVAAWTMLAFSPDVTAHAWQQTTIVDPDHRGHRLGTLVKIENVRFTQVHEPALRFIDTWNAASNAPMIAINELLGFRAVDTWIGCQADI